MMKVSWPSDWTDMATGVRQKEIMKNILERTEIFAIVDRLPEQNIIGEMSPEYEI